MPYIPVSQRTTQQRTGYVPVSQRKETPVSQGGGLLTSFEPITPKSASQPFTGFGFGLDTIPQFAKSFAREVVRQPASVGVEISSRLDQLTGKKKITELGPKDFAGIPGLEQTARFLFGDEPVPSLEKRIEAGTEIAKKMGFEGDAAKVASGLFILGITSSDFLLFGGQVDDVVKALRTANKAKDVAGASKILKAINVADDLIPEAAKKFALEELTDDGIKQGLETIAKTQQATKTVKTTKYVPVAERGLAAPTSPVAKSLDDTARIDPTSFKTAEDYVKAQGTIGTKTIDFQKGEFGIGDTKGTKITGTFDDLTPKTRQELIDSKKALDNAKGTGAENTSKAGDRYFKAQEVAQKEIEAKTRSQLIEEWNKAQKAVAKTPDIQSLAQEARKIAGRFKLNREYTTEGGKFSEYFLDGNKNLGQITVEKMPTGYRIRNVFIDYGIRGGENLQRQGIATEAYRKLNLLSLQKTGKPLRSSTLFEVAKKGDVTTLNREGRSLWESFVKRGEAELVDGRYYQMTQPTDIFNQAVREAKEPGIPGKRGLTKVGLAPEAPRKITRTEPQLLKSQLRAEARTAKAVKGEDIKALNRFARAEARQTKRAVQATRVETRNNILTKLRATTEAVEDIKKQVVDFAKTNLNPADRGKAITLVRDAKTQKNLTKAFSRIERWADDAEKKITRNEIIKLQKSISDSPSIAIDYKNRIKEVVNDFELRGHRTETIEKLKATREFLNKETAKGNDVELPRRILKSLETLNRTPFDQLTTNQLKGALAEMELLEELGKAKFRTRTELANLQKEAIVRAVQEQAAEPLNNLPMIKPEIGERLTFSQKGRNFLHSTINEAARIDKAISPMDVIFDLLDGGKGTYAGANFKFFKARVDAGYGRYITRKDALQEPVAELIAKHGIQDTNLERMGVVAAREQDGGVEKLINSGFTQSQIDAVKLTKEEQEVLDLMRKTFDDQFPEIQDVMKNVYNEPVQKVKNYFSFMTDWKAMDDVEVFRRFGSQNPEQFGAPTKNVEIGFTKSRVGPGEQKIRINALDIFLKHTDNISYLLELGETTKTLGEIANAPAYANAVGDVGQLLVKEWVDVIARKGGSAGASEIAALDVLRKNVGAGILGLKLSTIAIQPTALIDGMGFIGTRYTARGVQNFTTSTDWRKFIGNMPEIKDRMGGEFALRELTDDSFFQNIQRKGFIPMQIVDQITAGMIATGAYVRKMDELGLAIDLTKGYNDEALKYAQLAVRRTQSTGAFKDVPLAVSRGALTGNRSLDRALLQFQNFLLTRWSRIRHDAIRAGIRTGDPKKAIPILTSIVMAAIAGSGIRLGVNRIIDFITGDEDDKEAEERLMSGFIYEMTGNVPFLGTATSMWMYDGEMFPILDAPKGVISGLGRVINSKSPEAKMRGFAEFAGSVGQLGGIPGSAQTEQFIRKSVPEEKKSDVGLPKLPKLPTLPELPKLPTF